MLELAINRPEPGTFGYTSIARLANRVFRPICLMDLSEE